MPYLDFRQKAIGKKSCVCQMVVRYGTGFNRGEESQNHRLSVPNAPYTLHPTPYTLHPTPYTTLPIPDSRFPIPDSLLPTQLKTFNSRLLTYSQLQHKS
ncbi:MAG: hypothetical protein F6K55_23175 [Moorea sp. SIO4A3]|nr:hypothetical protein [Moorena sp. SIO4A3]